MWDFRTISAGVLAGELLIFTAPTMAETNYSSLDNYKDQVCIAQAYKSPTKEAKPDKLFRIPEPYYDTITDAVRKHGRIKDDEDFRHKVALVSAVFKCGEHSSGPYTLDKLMEKGYSKSAANLTATWPSSKGPWASSPAGCRGPFQFIGGTWRKYGEGNINNLIDSANAAANYLTANMESNKGSREQKIRKAISMYNHSEKYIDTVYRCYQEFLNNPQLLPKSELDRLSKVQNSNIANVR